MTTYSSQGLAFNTQYYVRVKHEGILSGESNWSPTLSFKTKALPIPTNETELIAINQTLPPTNGVDDYEPMLSISDDGEWLVIARPQFGAAFIYQRVSNVWTLYREFAVNRSPYNASVAYPRITRDGLFIFWFAPQSSGSSSSSFSYIKRTGNTWSQRLSVSISISQWGDMDIAYVNHDFVVIRYATSSYSLNYYRKRVDSDVWDNTVFESGSFQIPNGQMSKDGKTFIAWKSPGVGRVFKRNSLAENFVFKYQTSIPSTVYVGQWNRPGLSYDGSLLLISTSHATTVANPVVKLYGLGPTSYQELQTFQDDNAQNHTAFGCSAFFSEDSNVLVIDSGNDNNNNAAGIGSFLYVRENGVFVLKEKLIPSVYSYDASFNYGRNRLGRTLLSKDGQTAFVGWKTDISIFK